MKLLVTTLCLVVTLALACGGDDDDSSDTQPGESNGSAAATQAPGDDGAAPTEAPSESGGDVSSANAAGTLTLGDEVIDLNRARCFLQEQDVAGSEGKILFTAQGFGTTAAGEDFVLDVSRYDEDSLFTGDDIQVDVGNPFGDDFYSWDGSAELGTIELNGSSLAAGGLTFRHPDDGSGVPGAFQVNC